MTSSGQSCNPQAYTAAHNSLHFGTEITVKNVYTGRSVQAVVNDRFPYYPGRIVNLSSAAAHNIGMTQMQLSRVHVTAKSYPRLVIASNRLTRRSQIMARRHRPPTT
jgi:rare lipoprotein A